MSYCVNCGVELAPSEKKCPLCGTEVLNPKSPWSAAEQRPYPHQVEKVMRKIDVRYGAALASLLLLIPLMLSIIANLIINKRISWSAYVFGGTVLAFFTFLFPCLLKKRNPILLMTIDGVILLLYLFVIDAVNTGGIWFWPLGLPLVLSAWVSLAGLTAIYRLHVLKGLYFAGFAVMVAGLLSVAVEVITKSYAHVFPAPFWSIFVFVPALVIGIVLIVIEKKKKLKEEIKRRLFL